MAKVKGFLSGLSVRLSGSLFKHLSMLEDKNILPRITKWVKLSVLGFFVMLTSALSLEAKDDIIMCYKPIPMPPVTISDLQIKPNPTNGADSVVVTAAAMISFLYYEDDAQIARAWMQLGRDTMLYQMRAVDGSFGDTFELLEGRLFVGNLEPETTWIDIGVVTSHERTEIQSLQLIISEPEADSTEKTEE
jgi:hypothetical protein